MSISIQRFKIDNSADWDDLVWKSNNGTIFHTRKFFSYHPPDRFEDHSLVFTKKERLFSLFPAAEMMLNDKRWLVSHSGASFGSFVVPEDLSFADAKQVVEMLVNYAGTSGFSGVRLTLPPTIYNRRLSNYIDFALVSKGFAYARREVSSILFLETDSEATLQKFKPSHRRAVNKARKSGVVVRQSNDYAAFFQILQKNLKIRHGVEPTHTLDELLRLKEIFPDRIILFGAYLGEKMVAGVVNFIVNDDVVLAFYISHDEEYQECRAVNLLFYTIFGWAIDAAYKVFDFGIFTVNEQPNFGLARFKENFGSSGMFRDTLEIQF